jgi:serine/threonine protein kinase
MSVSRASAARAVRCDASSGLRRDIVKSVSRAGVRCQASVATRARKAKEAPVDVDEDGLRRALNAQGLILGERIDQGSFAVVYKAESTGLNGYGSSSWQGEAGTVHAVKILSATASTVSSRRDFKREATLLTRVDHPGIVKVSYYDESPQPFMVTEFCTSGNLWNALRAEDIKANKFDDGSTVDIPDDMPLLDLPTLMKDVADALGYLHSVGFAHRDIKTSNILLTWSSQLNRIQAKLCDFGSAAPVKLMPRRPKRGTLEKVLGLGKGWQPVGTMLWMAPEMLRPPIDGEELDGFTGDKADVFALGVVLWECLEWRVPWTFEGAPTRARVLEEVVDNGSRLKPKSTASQPIQSLLRGMFKTIPAERPTASEISIALSAMQRRWDQRGMFQHIGRLADSRAREISTLLESESVDRETQNVIEEEAAAVAGVAAEELRVKEAEAKAVDVQQASASAVDDRVEMEKTDEPRATSTPRDVSAAPRDADKIDDISIRLTDIDPENWLGEPGTIGIEAISNNLVNMIFPHVLDSQFSPEMASEMAEDIEELQTLTNKYNELKRRSRTDPFAALATDSKGREVKRMTQKIERVEVEAQVKAWEVTRNILREQLKKAEEEHSSWKRTLRRI